MTEQQCNPLHSVTSAVAMAKVELPRVRFNARVLGFLCRQLEKIASADIPQGTAIDCEVMEILEVELRKGVNLMKQHAQPFNIRTFYKVEEVEQAVCDICSTFAVCLEDLGWKTITAIETSVSETDIDEDRRHMQRYLTCILEGTSIDKELGKQEQQDLERLIDAYKQRLHFLNIRIKDDDIQYEDNCIGEGGVGEVVRARWGKTPVAVKKLKVKNQDLSIESRAEFYSEVEVQMQMSSPNVVRVYGATNSNYLVMELADMDLGKFWRDRPLAPWHTKINLMSSASLGLKHLHDAGVVHRDVKPANFLLFTNASHGAGYTVKIADFGLALMKQEIRTKTMRKVGTELFMAPEVHNGEGHQFCSDVFSFGLVMYELAGESQPYQRHQSIPMLAKWKKEVRDPCSVGDDCPSELYHLMRKCIARKGNDRPSIADVFSQLEEICAKVKSDKEHRILTLDVAFAQNTF